jgi:hypothetical protein
VDHMGSFNAAFAVNLPQPSLPLNAPQSRWQKGLECPAVEQKKAHASSFARLPSRTANVSKHPLNPLNARRARFERITEVLGFADHLPVPELHNAYRV